MIRAKWTETPGLEKATSMNYLHAGLRKFLQAEDAPTAVEYAVMLALIIAVCIGAITLLGQDASGTFSNVALNTAVGSGS
jgi:pilus assembly protein Flp/PilA